MHWREVTGYTGENDEQVCFEGAALSQVPKLRNNDRNIAAGTPALPGRRGAMMSLILLGFAVAGHAGDWPMLGLALLVVAAASRRRRPEV